jgi:hypothetical protein
MFGKSDLADSLNRDLARARDKRDALASGVATLTAQIAELEARLSAENDRRERRERDRGSQKAGERPLPPIPVCYCRASRRDRKGSGNCS